MAFAVALLPDAGGGLSVPSLPLAMGVALPWFGHTLRAPSLAMRTAVAVPSFLDPPKIDLSAITWAYREIYRLYLIGADSISEIPLAQIQAWERKDRALWVSVEVPLSFTDSAIEEACIAHTGKEFIIYFGIVDHVGEQLAPFLRANITSVDVRKFASSKSAFLTGRGYPVSGEVKGNLSGVSRVTVEQSILCDFESIVIECATDPSAAVGNDTEYGEDEFIIGRVDYKISPIKSRMIVASNDPDKKCGLPVRIGELRIYGILLFTESVPGSPLRAIRADIESEVYEEWSDALADAWTATGTRTRKATVVGDPCLEGSTVSVNGISFKVLAKFRAEPIGAGTRLATSITSVPGYK
jgi:hypothetical protein